MSGPTLKHFILQQQVLNFYRGLIRTARALPDPVTRRETLGWFRAEIERHRHLTDIDAIETQLKVIRREAKQVLP